MTVVTMKNESIVNKKISNDRTTTIHNNQSRCNRIKISINKQVYKH